MFDSVAAGAGRYCAPAAPIGASGRPLNFTVRRSLCSACRITSSL